MERRTLDRRRREAIRARQRNNRRGAIAHIEGLSMNDQKKGSFDPSFYYKLSITSFPLAIASSLVSK